MKKFTLIGVGGYIAPRHLKAIKDTGNILVAALDKHDSVGILDSYFPNCSFFTEFERFDRHINKLYCSGDTVDYLSICSPNYLHDAHIRYGLRMGMNVICEKPLVINYKNFEYIKKLENDNGNKVNVILQLRLHPEIVKLKNIIDNSKKTDYKINLQYFTPRGKWYDYSWKSDVTKSGGLLMNIGVHFFDLLIWIFGPVVKYSVEKYTQHKSKGTLVLKKGIANWNLSIDRQDCKFNNYDPYRLLKVDDEIIDLNYNFVNLHTLAYQQILDNNGFSITNCEDSIKLVNNFLKYYTYPGKETV